VHLASFAVPDDLNLRYGRLESSREMVRACYLAGPATGAFLLLDQDLSSQQAIPLDITNWIKIRN
jgi:hypothetical protein